MANRRGISRYVVKTSFPAGKKRKRNENLDTRAYFVDGEREVLVPHRHSHFLTHRRSLHKVWRRVQKQHRLDVGAPDANRLRLDDLHDDVAVGQHARRRQRLQIETIEKRHRDEQLATARRSEVFQLANRPPDRRRARQRRQRRHGRRRYDAHAERLDAERLFDDNGDDNAIVDCIVRQHAKQDRCEVGRFVRIDLAALRLHPSCAKRNGFIDTNITALTRTNNCIAKK